MVVGALAVLAAVAATSASGQPLDTKTLVVDTSFAIRSPDPYVSGQATAKLISRVRFDTLLTYTAGVTATPQPDVATKFTVSPHAKVFTFTLRKNVRFADGTKLTSADVVFSIRRALYLKQDASQLLQGVTVSAPDAYTVVVKSNIPNPAIPLTLSNPQFGIVNSKLAAAHGAVDTPDAATADKASAWFSSPDSQGVGSGPYTLAEYNPASQITLGQNKKWWQGKPHWDTIVLRNMLPAAQSLSVQRGTHEVALDLGAADVPTLQANSNLKVITTQSPSVFLIGMNVDPSVSAISANKKFQEAVRYAIDYKALVALAGPGGAQVGNLIPPSVPGALPAAQGLKRDLAKAKAAYAASGVHGSITLEYPSDRAPAGLSFASLAQKIQANLQEAGIDVSLQGEPVATFVAREVAKKVAFGLFVNVPGTFDGLELTRFTPGGGLAVNFGWNAGAALDVQKAALQARFVADPVKRAQVWQSVQKLLNTSSPFIGLIVPTQVLVATKDLANVNFNPLWLVDLSRIRPVT